MFRSSIFFLITFIFLLPGYTRDSVSSDHQMLEHFNLYESEFERSGKISVEYNRFHYLPYGETDSTAYIISYKDKKELDSLIEGLDTTSIQYDGISEVRLLFHIWGVSISEGCEKYIYAPNLEDYIKNYGKEIALDPSTEMYIVEGITERDLDQVAQGYSVNIGLYRPIENGWYIHFSRKN